ncbi:MAG: hypothetical protein WDM89_10010 [Rhizomicrobium sp.]
MAKSGSTLGYELVKGVLMSAGHSQKKVNCAAMKPRGRGNHIAELSREAILDAVDTIGPARIVAAKTHRPLPADMFSWMEDMQAARKVQVFASYRDPRDICLSLIDHGARAREAGRSDFAHVDDLADAADMVSRAILKFRRWASLAGTEKLYFDTVAFEPDTAISRIEHVLGVTADHDAVKHHAFEDAFTQKNKARKHRFEDELDDAQKRELAKRFAGFIEHACQSDDPAWFAACREQMLANVA